MTMGPIVISALFMIVSVIMIAMSKPEGRINIMGEGMGCPAPSLFNT